MDRQQLLERFYPETRFGGFSRHDGTIAFFTRVQALAQTARLVVDVGCGRGQRRDDRSPFRRKIADLRASGRKVIGMDVSAAGHENPFIDEFHQIDPDSSWPLPDNSVDLILTDYVLEHVKEPRNFYGEATRVLRPGGYFCARTPNKWAYVCVVSMLVPQKWHAAVVGKAQSGRREEDVFPTVYRSNTVGAIRRHLITAGLDGVILTFEAEPNYFEFSSAIYSLGVVIHRLMPPLLRSQLFIFAQKRGASLSPPEGAGN